MKVLQSGLCVLILVSLMGCISYHDTIIFNDDFSGSMEYTIGIDQTIPTFGDSMSSVLQDSIPEYIVHTEGITITKFTTEADGDQQVQTIGLTFDSFHALQELAAKKAADDFWGSFELLKNANGTYTYKRTIHFDEHADQTDNDLMASFLDKNMWKYTVTFPTDILISSPPSHTIDTSRHRITWEYSLGEILDSTLVMTATIDALSKEKFPLWIVLIISALLLIFFIVVMLPPDRKASESTHS